MIFQSYIILTSIQCKIDTQMTANEIERHGKSSVVNIVHYPLILHHRIILLHHYHCHYYYYYYYYRYGPSLSSSDVLLDFLTQPSFHTRLYRWVGHPKCTSLRTVSLEGSLTDAFTITLDERQSSLDEVYSVHFLCSLFFILPSNQL